MPQMLPVTSIENMEKNDANTAIRISRLGQPCLRIISRPVEMLGKWQRVHLDVALN